MKKIITIISVVLGIVLGGYFLYKMLFHSKTLSHDKITKKTNKKIEQNKTKYKYVNPDSKDDFHRNPVVVKSVFKKKQKQEIEKKPKKIEITEAKKELIMLKNKIKKPYYFSLLSWKFSGTMNNVLLINYKMYNLTLRPYNGMVHLKCTTLDKDKKVIGDIMDNMFVSINSFSTKNLKDIVGIIEPYNVVNVNCVFSINKINTNIKNISSINKTNNTKNTSLNTQETKKQILQKKQNNDYVAPLNLFK